MWVWNSWKRNCYSSYIFYVDIHICICYVYYYMYYMYNYIIIYVYMWLDFGKLTQLSYYVGLFHLIGSANSYTHTLSINSAINRIGWLVCFSRASFANHVNSQLKQQNSWRALHERHGSEIDPGGSEMSLSPLNMLGSMAGTSWTHGCSKHS